MKNLIQESNANVFILCLQRRYSLRPEQPNSISPIITVGFIAFAEVHRVKVVSHAMGAQRQTEVIWRQRFWLRGRSLFGRLMTGVVAARLIVCFTVW